MFPTDTLTIVASYCSLSEVLNLTLLNTYAYQLLQSNIISQIHANDIPNLTIFNRLDLCYKAIATKNFEKSLCELALNCYAKYIFDLESITYFDLLLNHIASDPDTFISKLYKNKTPRIDLIWRCRKKGFRVSTNPKFPRYANIDIFFESDNRYSEMFEFMSSLTPYDTLYILKKHRSNRNVLDWFRLHMKESMQLLALHNKKGLIRWLLDVNKSNTTDYFLCNRECAAILYERGYFEHNIKVLLAAFGNRDYDTVEMFLDDPTFEMEKELPKLNKYAQRGYVIVNARKVRNHVNMLANKFQERHRVNQVDQVENYLKEKLQKMLLIDKYRTIFHETLLLLRKKRQKKSQRKSSTLNDFSEK